MTTDELIAQLKRRCVAKTLVAEVQRMADEIARLEGIVGELCPEYEDILAEGKQ